MSATNDNDAYMDQAVRQEIGLRLKAARQAAGMTQDDVASHMELTRQAVSCWEHGRSMPTFEEARELAVLYQVSLDTIALGNSRTESLTVVRSLLVERAAAEIDRPAGF